MSGIPGSFWNSVNQRLFRSQHRRDNCAPARWNGGFIFISREEFTRPPYRTVYISQVQSFKLRASVRSPFQVHRRKIFAYGSHLGKINSTLIVTLPICRGILMPLFIFANFFGIAHTFKQVFERHSCTNTVFLFVWTESRDNDHAACRKISNETFVSQLSKMRFSKSVKNIFQWERSSHYILVSFFFIISRSLHPVLSEIRAI